VGRLRHVVVLAGLAALLVWVVAPLICSGTTPFIDRLSGEDRVEFYKQVSTISASLLGFLITAVAILVSLDMRRRIVEDLHRGESFSLLVVNLLAAVAFLFLLTVAGVAGGMFDDGEQGAAMFGKFYETFLLASLFELGLGGFYFGLVTYKVASHD
jgi:hypothetical protein